VAHGVFCVLGECTIETETERRERMLTRSQTCTHPFANNLFFPREGKAYCTECFERMN
jgi:hypothetical protein